MQLINNAAASSNTNNRVYKPRIFSESDLSLLATVKQTRVPSSSWHCYRVKNKSRDLLANQYFNINSSNVSSKLLYHFSVSKIYGTQWKNIEISIYRITRSHKPIKVDVFSYNSHFWNSSPFLGRVKMHYHYVNSQLVHLSVFLRCNIRK